MRKKAIIYCRVSSDKQVREGHGLESQEKRGRDFAKSKKYQVVKVVHEKGVSGGKVDRPELNNLIDFLVINEGPFIVIFDDISRLARGVDTHRLIIKAIKEAGAEIYCLNMKIGGDNPEDLLAETIVAATKEYERLSN